MKLATLDLGQRTPEGTPLFFFLFRSSVAAVRFLSPSFMRIEACCAHSASLETTVSGDINREFMIMTPDRRGEEMLEFRALARLCRPSRVLADGRHPRRVLPAGSQRAGNPCT